MHPDTVLVLETVREPLGEWLSELLADMVFWNEVDTLPEPDAIDDWESDGLTDPLFESDTEAEADPLDDTDPDWICV